MSNGIFHRHKLEIIVGLAGVGASIVAGAVSVSDDFAWFTGVISASFALSVGIIKDFVSSQLNEITTKVIPRLEKTSKINDIMASASGPKHVYASKQLDDFVARLSKIESGRFPLTESEYYSELIEKVGATKEGDHIFATNSIDERRWSNDSRQLNYMAANDAALSRNVLISRIFIVDKNNLSDPLASEGLLEIDRQLRNKDVDAYVVWRESLPQGEDLINDWVLFEGNDPEIFHAFADVADKTRVAQAEKICGLNEKGVSHAERYRDDFKRLLAYKVSPDFFRSELVKNTALNFPMEFDESATICAPGPNMVAKNLNKNVVSCEEAAAAKKIPLSNELKTIIVETSQGTILVHVCGNQSVSNRKVKNRLDVKQAVMASRKKMDELGVVPGTVSPVFEPLWSMKHLIDLRVMQNEYVSTNNGTLNNYITFSPKVLLQADSVIVGDFSDVLETDNDG